METQSEQYRSFPDLPHFPLGDGLALVYSPATSSAHVLSAQHAALLQSCRTFAALEEHAARVAREHRLNLEQARAVHAALAALARAGLLASRSELAARCRRRFDLPEPPPRIAVVGIPTRGRAGARRCLESHLESGRRHGRAAEYVVIDDSPDPETRRSVREMLRELGGRFAADVCYAGSEEKEAYVRKLAAAGASEEAARFALLNPEGFPITTGGSRNALLLHAVGELLLQVDDDTLCRVAPAPEVRPGLALSSRHDPTEFWFPAGEPSAAGEDDLLAVHERLLGRGLADCAAEADPDPGEAGAEFFRRLDRGEGRVLVTAAGAAGHSGMGSSLYFLSLEGESRARLLASEETYRRALAHHQVVRTATRPTVCDGSYCMALNLGLDHRRPLPPFPPVQRNQDGVFAALLRTCRDDGFFGFLPGGVVHAPPDRPLAPSHGERGRGEGTDDLARSAAGLRSGQILQVLVRSLPAPAGLPVVGRTLAEWAAWSLNDFEEWLRLCVWPAMSRQVGRLADQLQRFGGQPDYWADDVRRVLAVFREALPRKEYVIPTDLNACFGPEAARERFRRLVLQFARLLQAWPDIVEAARDLRAQGVRLAVRP